MPLRILHVLDHSWPVLDGYAQRSLGIAAAQLQLGMQPSVLTSPLHQQDDPSASETFFGGVRYFRTTDGVGLAGRAVQGRWPFLRELAVMQLLRRRIVSLIKSGSYDIVHAHSPALCGQAASQAAHFCHVPFVYEIRAFWEDGVVSQKTIGTRSMRYWLGKNLETRVARRADAVVAIARPMVDDLESRGIPRAKLFHVPNGVDAARFVPQQRDAALAAQLGVGQTPTLGYLGTLFPWEGVSWLVRAAAELRKRGLVFKLLIVGDGADSAEVKKEIEETGSSSYVSFLGRVPHDQVERYYSLMDVMVYPRLSVRLTEMVTPLKPLEAMALGKAVLGSSVGGIRELIEPEVTGMLFKPGNIEDFCRQAARLLLHEDVRIALGNGARRRVLEERDWKVVVQGYEDVYEAARRNAGARS